jgi:hypothetical protein
MSGVRTRQRKLHFVPLRADGPSVSIDYRQTSLKQNNCAIDAVKFFETDIIVSEVCTFM